ncbi:MAG: hypothetical protein Q9223_001961 [Gallowayella weberi]
MNPKMHLALLALAAPFLMASPIVVHEPYPTPLDLVAITTPAETITIEPTHTVTSTVPGTTVTQTIVSPSSKALHTLTVTSTSKTTTTSTPTPTSTTTATSHSTSTSSLPLNPLPTTWATLQRRQVISDPPTREGLEEYARATYRFERFNAIG